MDFWSKFEYHVRDRVTDFLIRLLKNSGYDTAFSIKLLNDKLLDQLEIFGNEEHLQPKQPFKLLPGHRSALLALPSIVEQFEKNIDESITLNQKRVQSCEDTNFPFIFSKLNL